MNPNGICDKLDVAPATELPPPKVKRRLKNNRIINDDILNNTEKSNHKLTEFFPVRRSIRKTKKTVLEEKQKFLEEALRSGKEDGLLIREFDGKGRGVIAGRTFFKGDFVVEYSGELIDINEARLREQKYAQDQSTGCYMYYFKHKNQQYCVDATAETGRFGRLVNHSRNGNLLTRTVSIDNKPRLVLIAKDTIEKGDEVTYDYGDRSKESLKHHPWLAF
ncbi:n-lysine methyltransferase kmt5a [Holotrichia oblita]|uniref:N-lysine methyltransferase kmt5a n=1 Tax=Holotrichia oblita TaxID=644536 RepID=A0ACB9SHG6_HOLOL|nr:n-lysine methyltransferase kmt5a [Holotrichia oblita]